MVNIALPVLDRDHPPRGEAAAVADAVHLVDDRRFRIARQQEIGVQRMRQPLGGLDRAVRRDQRLAHHLPAIDALPAILRAASTEKILFELLQVENFSSLSTADMRAP